MRNDTHLSDADFAKLSPKTQELFNNLSNAIIDMLMVPAEWLPESYRGKKKMRKLRSVVNESKRRQKTAWKPDREVSVKFDSDRNITSARPGRLAVLEKYAADVAAGREIQYDVDEDKLYRVQLDFVSAGIKAGMFEVDEFESDECETWVYENEL